MSWHALQALIQNGKLGDTGQAFYAPTYGYMLGWGVTVGNSVEGWAKGALFIDLDASAGARLSINEGTNATASWKTISALDAANTWAGLQTFGAGASLPTAQTLAVSTADKLTVGGVIVPQSQVLFSGTLQLGTVSQLIYTVFTARDAWQITNIDYLVDTANAAGTGCAVKAGGTTAPATSSSPLLTAAVGLTLGTTGINTVQVGTLTTTTAHLQLTAGDRVVWILTTAMLLGQGCLTVRGKRI